MKRLVLRTCVGCRGTFPQKQLLRITGGGEAGVSLDFKQKLPGRGAYLCYNQACLEAARKRQSLQRALKKPLPDHIWTEIDEAVKAAQDKGEE
ncbi:MAG: YlxR family protein [Clostridiaceae bacterium]|nr:YlxR family protein [Clostridiaceae bacterium]